MKKILFLFAILFIAVIVYALLSNKQLLTNNINSKKIIDYKLNNKNYRLLVADSQETWIQGLMNYKKLDNADGMIFIFPDKKYQKFWNKNTYLDLDIYWLDDDRVVGRDFLPSITKSKETVIVSSPQPVNRVIEIVKLK